VTANRTADRKTVNFALQGGGAHGAFVWGVLDQVLEDGRLAIEAISATSAGAMNAVAMASGMAHGGGEAARESLHAFWYEVSRMDMTYDLLSPLNQWIQALRLPPEYHPVHAVIHTLTHTLPPNLLNPFHFNPLRALLQRVVDFDRLNGLAIPLGIVEALGGVDEIENRKEILSFEETGSAAYDLLELHDIIDGPHEHDVAHVAGIYAGG